jgi:hypothetical protein
MSGKSPQTGQESQFIVAEPSNGTTVGFNVESIIATMVSSTATEHSDMAASKTPKPPPGKADDPAGPESKIPGATGARPAGQIVHDERGNAVWKWGEDGNRSDSTSRVLRRLDVPDLTMEGQDEPAQRPDKGQAAVRGQPKTNQHNAPKTQTRAPMIDAGGGYNPYNLSVPVKKHSAPKKPIPPKGSGGRSR